MSGLYGGTFQPGSLRDVKELSCSVGASSDYKPDKIVEQVNWYLLLRPTTISLSAHPPITPPLRSKVSEPCKTAAHSGRKHDPDHKFCASSRPNPKASIKVSRSHNAIVWSFATSEHSLGIQNITSNVVLEQGLGLHRAHPI